MTRPEAQRSEERVPGERSSGAALVDTTSRPKPPTSLGPARRRSSHAVSAMVLILRPGQTSRQGRSALMDTNGRVTVVRSCCARTHIAVEQNDELSKQLSRQERHIKSLLLALGQQIEEDDN
jgi:hypothetical protein